MTTGDADQGQPDQGQVQRRPDQERLEQGPADQARQVVYDGHIVRLEILEGKWEVVRHADAVTVLALNERGEMLLVRQDRPAVGHRTAEVPAGLIDPGETPEQAARRELQEEAGLDGEMTLLTRFYVSPGFCDEELHVFYARHLRPSKLPHDADEEGLTLEWMAPQAVLSALRTGDLVGSASTVTAALYALRGQAALDEWATHAGDAP